MLISQNILIELINSDKRLHSAKKKLNLSIIEKKCLNSLYQLIKDWTLPNQIFFPILKFGILP